MTGLVYEIVWMKLLVLVMGNTVYSTTTVLAAFMGGLGLGSFLAGRFLHRVSLPLRTYGYVEGAIGLYALAVPLLVAAAELVARSSHPRDLRGALSKRRGAFDLVASFVSSSATSGSFSSPLR